jgi:hypothetical protein
MQTSRTSSALTHRSTTRHAAHGALLILVVCAPVLSQTTPHPHATVFLEGTALSTEDTLAASAGKVATRGARFGVVLSPQYSLRVEAEVPKERMGEPKRGLFLEERRYLSIH